MVTVPGLRSNRRTARLPGYGYSSSSRGYPVKCYWFEQPGGNPSAYPGHIAWLDYPDTRTFFLAYGYPLLACKGIWWARKVRAAMLFDDPLSWAIWCCSRNTSSPVFRLQLH